ncbi:MAG: hypothetical protein DRP67_02945 [Candidatus Omnitrophota bacterium]|nr:MAG: hypothetical protein DRP67_02945 [Candidatus Omnitrophota bacterium]
MKEEHRLLLAFLLSLLIILIYGSYYRKKYPVKKVYHPVEKKVVEERKDKFSLEYSPNLFQFQNEYFVGKIDACGGLIKEIGLKNYVRENEKYFYIFENSLSLFDFCEDINRWKKVKYDYRYSDGEIILEGRPYPYLKEEKRFKISPRKYSLKFSINFINKKKKSLKLKDYTIIGGKIHIGLRRNRYDVPVILVKSKGRVYKKAIERIHQKIDFEDTSLICCISRYKMVLLQVEEKGNGFVVKEGENVVFGIKYSDLRIEKDYKIEGIFYAGPSDYFIASKEIKEDIFGRGLFVSIGRFLFLLLSQIYKVIPNWGWSIILLTLLIRAVFFPLTKSSLYSMKQLQKLRPYLKDIQQKYKDNPYQLQKELMNIYREYKINPFGGCIPFLIQIPIFIGFFISLRNSIFLRGAPFILWIKDLSLPDTIFRIGKFPVNILPILMTITSYIQQKFTPTDPSQRSLAYFIPLLFLFLFYNFSSGLLLYWVTMNIAAILEQYFIYRK